MKVEFPATLEIWKLEVRIVDFKKINKSNTKLYLDLLIQMYTHCKSNHTYIMLFNWQSYCKSYFNYQMLTSNLLNKARCKRPQMERLRTNRSQNRINQNKIKCKVDLRFGGKSVC